MIKDPYYEGYYLLERIILDNFVDTNPERKVFAGPLKRFIYPSLSTSKDSKFPLIVIQMLPPISIPISPGNGYLGTYTNENKSVDVVSGNKLTMTYTILLYTKREDLQKVIVDGKEIEIKNDLLANMLFSNLLKAIYGSQKIISDEVYYYNPNSIKINTGFDDSNGRIVRSLTLSFDCIVETIENFDESKVINKIEARIYENDLPDVDPNATLMKTIDIQEESES